MTFLKTLLTATILCAAMLAFAVFRTGNLPEAPYAGLTAANVLGADGTAPEAPGERAPRLDRTALGRLAAEAARGNPGPLPLREDRG